MFLFYLIFLYFSSKFPKTISKISKAQFLQKNELLYQGFCGKYLIKY
ncbi:hypothetical protein HMPREF9422_0126 [Streptococcus cristatus ATCC 51100]|nr:hypothetical protein HMPREF9422_0126 [Streptococcus cristatus ATCC 51100]